MNLRKLNLKMPPGFEPMAVVFDALLRQLDREIFLFKRVDVTGNKTFQLSDAHTYQHVFGAASKAMTIAPFAEVRFQEGTIIIGNCQQGATTIVAGTGVSLRWYTGAAVTIGTPRTLAVGAWWVLVKFDTDTWSLWGDGIT